MAVTTDGRLLVMGNSDHGKLGLADIEQQKSDDGRVAGTYRPMAANQKSQKGFVEIKDDDDKLVKIKQVACGFKHSAAITEDGELYMWGEGRHGQLGFNDMEDYKEPEKLDLTVKVEKVLCGANHTIFMDSEKRLYAMGDNRYG